MVLTENWAPFFSHAPQSVCAIDMSFWGFYIKNHCFLTWFFLCAICGIPKPTHPTKPTLKQKQKTQNTTNQTISNEGETRTRWGSPSLNFTVQNQPTKSIQRRFSLSQLNTSLITHQKPNSYCICDILCIRVTYILTLTTLM